MRDASEAALERRELNHQIEAELQKVLHIWIGERGVTGHL